MSVVIGGMPYYEPGELAGKPGMPAEKDDVNRRWGKAQPRKTRNALGLPGKGWMYPESCLPEETQAYLYEQRIQAAANLISSNAAAAIPAAPSAGGPAAGLLSSPAPAPSPCPLPAGGGSKEAPEPLTQKQQAASDARAAVLAAIDRLQRGAGCSRIAALHAFVVRANLRELDAETQALLDAALDARGRQGAGLISVRTLKRWQGAAHLAPGKRQKDHSIPAWGPALLARYRLPSKPTLAQAVTLASQDLAALGWTEKDLPNYFRAVRWFDKLPVSLLERGRNTGAAWRALQPCIRRDWAGCNPMDVWVGDGHTLKAKVRHPDHGRPFAPEVTVVMDAASRKVVGWAVSLSENQIAVSEALSHGLKTHGRPLIYYSDNGAGQTAKMLDAPLTGLLARLGIDHQTGIPGNPQGRGIIERLWGTLTIPLARLFPTAQTKNMDRDTKRRLDGEISRAQTKGIVPLFVPHWNQFIDTLDAAIQDYNENHAHRALKGASPATYFDTHKPDDAHLALDEGELLGLYRPEVVRVPQRGEISLFNNRYFLRDLAELQPGTPVRVAFDVHDAQTVWVKDLDGVLIGEAAWNGNLKDAFPKPHVESLKEARVDRAVKRLEKKADTARAELGRTLDHPDTLTIADFLPAQEPIVVEPEKTIRDFLPDTPAGDETGSFADTVLWLYGDADKESAEDEAAAR